MAAWFEEILTPDITVEVDGIAVPAKDQPFIKETPDLATFVKRSFDTHRELGTRIPTKIEKVRNADGTFVPKAEGVEQWRKDHLPKLYEAGVLARPPADPKEYGITRPEDMPEGLSWNEERATKFGQLGVKHHIPKEAMTELLQLHREAMVSTNEAIKTTYDEAMVGLHEEFGGEFEPRMEQAKRLAAIIFKDPESNAFFDETGLGNHPFFLSVLMRLAPYAAMDSSFMTGEGAGGTGGATGDDVRATLVDIYTNPKNPKHEAYMRADPKIMAEIDEMYKKAYGTAKIEIQSTTGTKK